jgi:hypothetical protein
MYPPCITIQIRDTLHSLVGLGPLWDQTPTLDPKNYELQDLLSILSIYNNFGLCFN